MAQHLQLAANPHQIATGDFTRHHSPQQDLFSLFQIGYELGHQFRAHGPRSIAFGRNPAPDGLNGARTLRERGSHLARVFPFDTRQPSSGVRE